MLDDAMKDPQRPTLGAIMIVKDEEERLASILSDIKGIVDEIVVVDTGSQDKTVSIARSYGAKVGFFTWCNDFSAARNKSIELAESDYLLWLDADDRVNTENQRKILDLITKDNSITVVELSSKITGSFQRWDRSFRSSARPACHRATSV